MAGGESCGCVYIYRIMTFRCGFCFLSCLLVYWGVFFPFKLFVVMPDLFGLWG